MNGLAACLVVDQYLQTRYDDIDSWEQESSKKQTTIATSTDWSSDDDSDDCWNGGAKERATYKMSRDLRYFSDDDSDSPPIPVTKKQAEGKVAEKISLQRVSQYRCSRTITFDDESSSSCSDSFPSAFSDEDYNMRVNSNTCSGSDDGSDDGDQVPVTKKRNSSRSPFRPSKDDIKGSRRGLGRRRSLLASSGRWSRGLGRRRSRQVSQRWRSRGLGRRTSRSARLSLGRRTSRVLGWPVSLLVGKGGGDLVGEGVGRLVSDGVGALLGERVGLLDRALVGERVGFLVGLLVCC
jgi:hypothetical protein